ncbi:YtxH domain-containing protein [Pontibacter rugosus]|uniref:YtxH domain-containing protein n=1 Tax=Pontibacter rugosus TaxID=1745966 RepID=A0ABW3SZW1_9BACT
MQNVDKDSNKILLATLAGIGAGVAAALLLAPKNGRDSRDELMRQLNKASDDVNGSIKRWTATLKSKYAKDDNSSDDEFDLVMHGSWSDVKSQLRRNYDDLTDEDLDYKEGGESDLLERLQTKLGKTRDEIVRMISDLK